MAYLLDTHVLIWYATGDSQLSKTAKNIVDDISKEKFISIGSIWEMGIKSSLGKLQFKPSFEPFILNEISLIGYKILQISPSHIFEMEKLTFHHRDPFDWLLVAQSLVENIPIVSIDAAFDNYGVNRIW